MEIRIAGVVNDSIVDGLGCRYTVFTQGCPHHCPGCHNPQSHDFAGGHLQDTDVLVKKIAANPLLSGATLSGGEPFCQPEACLDIAKKVHALGMNVWCYTGYTLEALQKEGDSARLALLAEVDVLVDGPFLQAEKSLELKYCGSKNQRLIDVKKTLAEGKIALWEAPNWDDL